MQYESYNLGLKWQFSLGSVAKNQIASIFLAPLELWGKMGFIPTVIPFVLPWVFPQH